MACYWTNADPHPITLHSGQSNSYAYGIAVSGGIVYTAGYFEYDFSQRQACTWTNGSTNLVLEGQYDTQAIAVAVSGSSVYMAGLINNGLTCCWLNNNPIPSYISARAYWSTQDAITVSGSMVYIAGKTYQGSYNSACYWNNMIQAPVLLSSPGINGEAYSIFLAY